MGKSTALAVVLACSACGVTPSVPPPPLRVNVPPPPVATAVPVVPPRDPFAIPELLADAPIPQEPDVFRAALVGAPLLPLHGIPAAPRTCEGWARRPRAKVPACDTPDTGRVALDWALEDRLGDESMDGRLASIEVCKGLDPGFVRAVRAELAPVECGDALAMPILARPPAGLTGPIFHALYGYAVAARAARVGATTRGQAELLSGLEVATAELPRSYGRAIALAGVAAAWTQLSPPDTSRVDHASLAAVEAMGAEGIGDAYRLEPARNWLTVPFGWLAEIDALQLPPAEPGGARAPPPPQPPSLGKMPCRDC